jgi:hypothetical protein
MSVVSGVAGYSQTTGNRGTENHGTITLVVSRVTCKKTLTDLMFDGQTMGNHGTESHGTIFSVVVSRVAVKALNRNTLKPNHG